MARASARDAVENKFKCDSSHSTLFHKLSLFSLFVCASLMRPFTENISMRLNNLLRIYGATITVSLHLIHSQCFTKNRGAIFVCKGPFTSFIRTLPDSSSGT